MPGSLVLIPTYNERANVTRLLSRLTALDGFDILVIDDSSPDGTACVVDQMRGRTPRLSLVMRERKAGLASAYAVGFNEALQRGYERVVTMDADLSHAPEDAPRLLDALDHADVSIGSRYAPGGATIAWPAGRRLLSRLAGTYARSLLRLPVKDVTSGFRAYRASALAGLDLERGFRSRGFAVQVELLHQILKRPQARVVEVPIAFRNRVRGSSKLSAAVVIEGALRVAALALIPSSLRGQRGTTAPAELNVQSTFSQGETHA